MAEANSTDLETQMASFDPTNPEALAALEKAAMGGEDVAAEATPSADDTPEPEAAPAKKDEPAPQDDKTVAAPPADKPAEPGEGTPSGTGKPKGVQARDGDHIIPYSVLERERDRASRAEATAKALAEQLQSLQSGKTVEAQAPANAGNLTEEDLAQLDTDLPGVAKVIRAQMAAIEAMQGTIHTLQQENEIEQQNRQAAALDQTEAAIMANADLKAWRDAATRKDNPDPLMWNRAAGLDEVLRDDPDWKDQPLATRFAKVVESMRSLYGVPAAATPTPPAPVPPAPQPATDLKQVADAKLKAEPAPVPTTLSDIPGGAAPAQSDIETIENTSAVALGQKFLSMSPDQMDAYLARIGI